MPVDLPNLLLGLLAAAIPLAGLAWQLQRRASLAEREIALLGERLATAQLAQDGLNAQLETSREAYQQLGERHARLSGEVAALRREAELMGEERQRASQAEARWASERQGREEEVRRLASERAALAAELREQQESHQQRLTDLQSARDELRAQFAELAGKIFDEREQRFAETSQQRLGQMLDPVADKLTQGAVAVCIAIRYPSICPLLFLLVTKELVMLCGACFLLHRGKKPCAAKWYGKVSTTLFYVSMVLIVVMDGFMQVPAEIFNLVSNIALIVTAAFMLYTFVRYFGVFREILRSKDGQYDLNLPEEIRAKKQKP